MLLMRPQYLHFSFKGPIPGFEASSRRLSSSDHIRRFVMAYTLDNLVTKSVGWKLASASLSGLNLPSWQDARRIMLDNVPGP